MYTNSVEFGGEKGAKTFHPSNKSQHSTRVRTRCYHKRAIRESVNCFFGFPINLAINLMGKSSCVLNQRLKHSLYSNYYC